MKSDALSLKFVRFICDTTQQLGWNNWPLPALVLEIFKYLKLKNNIFYFAWTITSFLTLFCACWHNPVFSAVVYDQLCQLSESFPQLGSQKCWCNLEWALGKRIRCTNGIIIISMERIPGFFSFSLFLCFLRAKGTLGELNTWWMVCSTSSGNFFFIPVGELAKC